MDTELLKTFLEVNRTRHFGRAAEHLCLTQSAVSGRIRQLEEMLGTALFVRARNNLRLTAHGERLVPYAETILTAWTRVKQDLAVADEAAVVLSVGGLASLWDVLLTDWLPRVSAAAPELAISAEVMNLGELTRRVRERTLDLGFAFESPKLSEVHTLEIATIDLIMVSTRAGLDRRQAAHGDDYCMVDWGTEFASAHARAFADMPAPRFRFGLGRLAHAFVLRQGGSLYLPEALVVDDLRLGRLHRVADAPIMQRAVYALYTAEANKDGLIDRVLCRDLLSP
jgi:DNA-binding transcriptional LysR family regulator